MEHPGDSKEHEDFEFWNFVMSQTLDEINISDESVLKFSLKCNKLS